MAEQPPARAVFPFVVARARSGTTLLRAMLDSHPELAIPPESHFITELAAHRNRYETASGFATTTFLSELFDRWRFRRWGMPEEAVRDALEAQRPADYPSAIRTLFQLYASLQGKTRYGDKSPPYVMHLPLLAELSPEARFVHVIRDGRDVALSHLGIEGGDDGLMMAALHWRQRVEAGRAAGRNLGPQRYLEVRYEELVTNPEAVLRPICEHLSLDFVPEMLDYHERAEDVLRGTSRQYHPNVSRPPSSLRDWRHEMSAGHVRAFELVSGDLLEELGYERATPPEAAAPTAAASRQDGSAQPPAHPLDEGCFLELASEVARLEKRAKKLRDQRNRARQRSGRGRHTSEPNEAHARAVEPAAAEQPASWQAPPSPAQQAVPPLPARAGDVIAPELAIPRQAHFQHLVLTRFNVITQFSRPEWTESGMTPRGLSPEWLDARFALFERHCLPTMLAQTCQDFIWVIYCHPETPQHYRDRLAACSPRVELVLVDEVSLDSPRNSPWRTALGPLMDPQGDFLLTTWLDNDDGFNVRSLATIQGHAQSFLASREDTLIYTFRYGCRLDATRGRALLHDHADGPFPSMFEKLQPGVPPKTALFDGHRPLSAQFSTIQDESLVGWLRVFHALTPERRLHGRISAVELAASALRADFPTQVLDGLRQPEESDGAAASFEEARARLRFRQPEWAAEVARLKDRVERERVKAARAARRERKAKQRTARERERTKRRLAAIERSLWFRAQRRLRSLARR